MFYKDWLRERVGNLPILAVYVAALIADNNGRYSASNPIPLTSLSLNESLPEACARLQPNAAIQRLLGVYSSPDFSLAPNEQSITAVFLCHSPTIQPANSPMTHSTILTNSPLHTAIVADLAKGEEAASFAAGNAGNGRLSPEPYYKPIRRHIGQQTLLMPSAAAFIQNEAGHILLQKRGDNGEWGMLGGGLDLGERLDQTVVNEVREESGLEVEPVQLIGLHSNHNFQIDYPHGDKIKVVSAFFECRPIGGMLQIDGVESLDLRYFPPEAIPSMHPRHALRIRQALMGKTAAFF